MAVAQHAVVTASSGNITDPFASSASVPQLPIDFTVVSQTIFARADYEYSVAGQDHFDFLHCVRDYAPPSRTRCTFDLH